MCACVCLCVIENLHYNTIVQVSSELSDSMSKTMTVLSVLNVTIVD